GRAPGAGDHRRGSPAGPRDAPRDGGLGRRDPLDARGQPRQVPERGQARPRAAARAFTRDSGRRRRSRRRRRAVLVAALYDVHGNLPALEAVLAEVDQLGPDVLLFGGDVAAGAFPHETIERLRGLDARFVMGNADRTLIDGTLGSMFDWSTTQVT